MPGARYAEFGTHILPPASPHHQQLATRPISSFRCSRGSGQYQGARFDFTNISRGKAGRDPQLETNTPNVFVRHRLDQTREWWPEKSYDLAGWMALLPVTLTRNRGFNGISRCGRMNARESLCLKGHCDRPIHFPILWPEIELSQAPRPGSRRPRWDRLMSPEHVLTYTHKPHEGN